jgi:hypothetical protein
MEEVLWQGTSPQDKKMCPYSIDFTCKPAPARTLDSLESGRLMLTVDLKGAPGAGRVYEVVARLVNKAKEKRSNGKSADLTAVTGNLIQDGRNAYRWTGELDIPVTWTEGGTRTYSRSGLWQPESKGALFALDITYRVYSGNSCTARFGSEDAFHWVSDKEKAIM